MSSSIASTPSEDENRGVAAGWLEAPAPSPAILDLITGLDRTARHPKLIDGPGDAAARFEACTAVVIGAGSVGQRVIDSLARLGIGGLWICDPGNTKPESLLTHPISPDQVGLPKALLAARRAAEISSTTRVRYSICAFEALPLDALVGATHLVIASDNLAAEVAVTQACIRLGLPHLQASVYGPALVAQVRSLPGNDRAAGPCICCGFVARDWEDLDAGTRFSCEGEANAAPVPTASMTMSFPHLCAIAADLAVGELCAQLLSLGARRDPARGASLEYCGYHGGTTRTPLLRNPECPLEHAEWTVRSIDASVAQLAPRDFVRLAGYDDFRDVSIRVESHCFASRSVCDCSSHSSLERFFAEGVSPPGPCPACGGNPVLHPLHTYTEVPGRAFTDCLGKTLAELGVRADPNVLVRGPRGSTLVRSVAQEDSAPHGEIALPPPAASVPSHSEVSPR